MTQTFDQPSDFIFVLDTNVWLQTHLLRGITSEAALFHLKMARARICLPEIVEKELVKNVVDMGTRACTTIRESEALISRFVPNISRWYEKSGAGEDRTYQEAVAKRLLELGPLILRVPLTLEHFQAALDRVMAETPPNSPGNQQFKDSLLWEAVLTLNGYGRVVFVTSDKSFYRKKDYAKGLACNLLEDARGAELDINIFPDLPKSLARLSEQIPQFDQETVISNLAHALGAYVTELAAAKDGGFVIDSLGGSLSPLILEDPQELGLYFRLSFSVASEAHPGSQCQLLLAGEAKYHIDESRLTTIVPGDFSISWRTETASYTRSQSAPPFEYHGV